MIVLPSLVMIGIPKLLSQVDPEAHKVRNQFCGQQTLLLFDNLFLPQEMQSTLNMASQPMDLTSMMSQLLGGWWSTSAESDTEQKARKERKKKKWPTNQSFRLITAVFAAFSSASLSFV